MTKTEKKIQLVKQSLSSCVTSGTVCFTYGSIPKNRFNGAKKSYAFGVQYDEVIALVDTTVFGGGERGMVITLNDVYIKEILTLPSHYKMNNLVGEFTLPGETYYNLRNLSTMLSKLQEIENEPEYGFWNVLGDIVGAVLEEGVKAVYDEHQKRVDEAEQEALELMEDFRDALENLINDVIDKWKEDYENFDTDEDSILRILEITSTSCLLVNGLDRYKKYAHVDEEIDTEAIEAAEQFIQMANLLVERFYDIFDDNTDEDIEALDRIFKRFNSSMIRIYNELQNDENDVDVTGLDMESYYNRTQAAIKTFRKKVFAIINYLNCEIEAAYED